MDVSLDLHRHRRVDASRRPRRASALFLFLALGWGIQACSEELDGGAACPSLCPGQNVSVLDTTFDAVALDTTIVGIPSLGAEGQLWVATRGDTLDTRAIIRFDSLTTRFTKAGADSAITVIDSAYILLRVNTTGTRRTAPVRIDVYDVDTTEADTVTAALRALFRPDRLIGGTTFDTALVKDLIKVFLDNAPLLAKITAKQRLRLGLRATSAAGVELNLGSVEGAQTAILRYDPAPADTAIKAIAVLPLSSAPTDQPQLQSDLADFSVVFAAPPAAGPELLSVGGLPARRAFFRFDVPSRIIDSSTVLRATLLLTQRPNRTIDPRDSLLVVPQLVVAGEEVTDLTRAAVLLSNFALDSLRIAPGDSGVLEIEIVSALRTWALSGTNALKQQRAVVLRSSREAFSPFEVLFFSRDAEPALRPRLRVSYALRTSFGIP
jgi:hypothetical protein